MNPRVEKKVPSLEYQRMVKEEALILDATELIYELLGTRNVSKSVLAARLGWSKSQLTQTLSGSRNMTLRTLADLADAFGVELEIRIKTKSISLPYDFKGPP